MRAWYQYALGAANVGSVRDAVGPRQLVRDRERQLKRGRARIGNDKMLLNWNGSSGGAQLNFRWKVAARMIADIVTAL